MRNRPLPQEVIQRKLRDVRHPLPEALLALECQRFQILQLSDKSFNDENSQNSAEAQTKRSKGENSEFKKEEHEIPPFIEHVVQKNDSLIHLSLKYDVSVSQLRQVNFLLTGDMIHHRKTWLIPTNGRLITPETPKPPTERELILRFKSRFGCTFEEANYYLQESNWEFETASKEFEEDKKWEASNQTFKPAVVLDPKAEIKKTSSRSFSLLCRPVF